MCVICSKSFIFGNNGKMKFEDFSVASKYCKLSKSKHKQNKFQKFIGFKSLKMTEIEAAVVVPKEEEAQDEEEKDESIYSDPNGENSFNFFVVFDFLNGGDF